MEQVSPFEGMEKVQCPRCGRLMFGFPDPEARQYCKDLCITCEEDLEPGH